MENLTHRFFSLHCPLTRQKTDRNVCPTCLTIATALEFDQPNSNAIREDSRFVERVPSASYSLTLRVKLSTRAGTLGEVATAIGRAGGDIGAIDIVTAGPDYIIRDITVNTISSEHGEKIIQAVKDIDGIEVINVSDRTFLMHLGGKIEVVPKMPLKTRADLSMAYTPGVARVCEAIHEDPDKAFTLTIKKNTVAVVTDGTAVLGLGDIGPAAAMPVMEGKAMLFKEFAGVNAFPICLNTKTRTRSCAQLKRSQLPSAE